MTKRWFDQLASIAAKVMATGELARSKMIGSLVMEQLKSSTKSPMSVLPLSTAVLKISKNLVKRSRLETGRGRVLHGAGALKAGATRTFLRNLNPNVGCVIIKMAKLSVVTTNER